MRTKIKQLAYLCGGLFLSLALAGFVAAQTTGYTTGNTGGTAVTCPDGSSVSAGATCPTTAPTMTTCPNGTQVSAGTTCPPAMTTCPDGTQVTAGTTCPTKESNCTNASGKWCRNSDGATGWCSYGSSPCPAYDAPSCTAQSGEWCAYTSGTGGWCATNGATCPINDESSCVAKGRPWCKSAGGAVSSGWCGDVGYKCPANDAPSCAAQNGEWCTSAGGTAASGWCQTGGGGCPINDSATCSAKARVWCPNSYGSGGWCASTGFKCDGTTNATPTVTQPTTTTNTFTCTNGTKVSDSSKCQVTTTPLPTTMSWPQSETECTKYKGVWCPPTSNSYGTSMGSCMMAGQSCPKATPTNMMTCWNGTQVSTSSSCPTTPSTSTDCTAKGGLWCSSATTASIATSGWCTSKDNGCPKYPPAGQMTCPDNQTYAEKLSVCPTGTTTTTQSDINYKTCPDGSLIKKDAECSKRVNYTVCPDGSKVIEGVMCPVVQKENEVTACAAKGYIWCVDKTSAKPGYCSTSGSCESFFEKEKTKNTVEEELGLNAKDVKKLDQQKKNLLRKLDTLGKFFTKVKDQDVLIKIDTLNAQIKGLPQDMTAFDSIELISDDIATLGDIKDAALNNGVDTQSEQDQALQKKALKQLKTNVARFGRQLMVIQGRVIRLEKSGIAVPVEIKDMISRAQGLIKQIQAAGTFDEARDAAETLRDAADDVNGALATLEQITRIQGLTKAIEKAIGSREAGFKRTQTLAKKLKVDVVDYVGEIDGLLTTIRESFNKTKSADFGESDPIEFVQTNIIDKLDDVDVKLANLNALTNLKGSIKLIGAQISKFDAQIKRLEKKKKDVAEMKDLRSDLNDHYVKLKNLAGQKITEDNLSEIVDELSVAANLSEQLNDMLQLNTPSALERELKKGLNTSGSLKGIDIPSLETSLLRSYRVATFIRQTPSDIAEYINLGGRRKVNTSRGAFAQDQ